MGDSNAPITQDALNRLETNLLREIAALKELHEEQTKALQALMDERAAGIAREWEKAQKEYDRRLLDLNNAHNLAVAEKERTVSKDMFEIYKEAQRKEMESVRSAARDATIQRASLVSTRAWALGTAIVVLGLTFALNFFFRKP